MLDPIGQAAIQSLAVDVANLTSRLAVAQATINQIITLGNDLHLGLWNTKRIEVPNRTTDESIEAQYAIVAEVPQEEIDKFQRLLSVLRELQQGV